MDVIPNELIPIIFENILKITDKRQFLRTCVLYNKITALSMRNFENNYKIRHFNIPNNYSMLRFALELCHDRYFDMIPMSYIISHNPLITDALAAFNAPLEILKLKKDNGCLFDRYTIANAALHGHLNVVKWLRENGCA